MSHYTLGAHQAHVSQQYISNLLVVNHIITPHYRKTITGRFRATDRLDALYIAAAGCCCMAAATTARVGIYVV